MNRIRAFLVLVLLVLIGGCSRESERPALQYATAPPAEKTAVYRFAVHPLHNPTKLLEVYQPLMDYLNRQIPDVRFELEASRDYGSFEEKFRGKVPEFILPNPWQTLQAMKDGYHVIAMAGKEEDFAGVFIVRKDSNIKSPHDLKGKSVSYPSPTALAACILPQYFLFQHGIDVNKDITNTYVGSQESSIMNVYLGESAAGATWPIPWRLFQREHPDKAAQLQVIWTTPHMQNNSVMVRDDVSPALVAKVTQLLLALKETKEGPAILDGMATQAFFPANDATYRPLEKFIADFERDVRRIQ